MKNKQIATRTQTTNKHIIKSKIKNNNGITTDNAKNTNTRKKLKNSSDSTTKTTSSRKQKTKRFKNT